MVIEMRKLPQEWQQRLRIVRRACDEIWYSFEAPLLPRIELEREREALAQWLDQSPEGE